MSANSHIRFITQEELNKESWNRCVHSSHNELIYGHTEYLDHMAKHWDGLVLNDYEAVMPLTWNMKWGIKYLYQPPLTPQLGIFSENIISAELVGAFLERIPKEFRFAEIFLNYANPYHQLKAQDNFVLDLGNPHPEISNLYKQDLLKNLKRASKHELIYKEYNDLDKALALHQHQYKERTAHVKDSDYERFRNLCHFLGDRGSVIMRSITGDDHELLALALLLRSSKRLYFMESTTLAKGRELQANHFLVDAVLREYSGQDLLFDFVGSSIPGIAHFYKNYGAENQPSYFYYLNKLPWWLRAFK